ncbi:MAG: Crp/Fnr family transcriptional regulator [Clostridia bacterium]|nr:Crp/Fnr family transcriptional regulator [Clostridia bacterium]
MEQKKQVVKRLLTLPLFTGAEDSNLLKVLTEFDCPVVTVAPGGNIGADHPRCLGVLLEGKAEIRSADSEKTVILRELNAPGVFGAASLFCEEDDPMSQIEAKVPCTVLFLGIEAVQTLLVWDGAFRNAYLGFLAKRVRFLNQKIRCFTAGSAERRLALWLTSEEGRTVTVNTTLTALAETLDIGRASLYRALDKLEAEGLIRHEGRKITVLSQEDILKKYK